MAFPRGVFYAYAKNSPTLDTTFRYLITFKSRSVADEWWRAVDDAKTFPGVKRISAQWFTHTPDVATTPAGRSNILNTIGVDQCAYKFFSKVMFTQIKDRDSLTGTLTTATPVPFTDNISGNRFFIRSLLQPNLFWYHNSKSTNGKICASTKRRTSFVVSIAVGKASENDGRVMIGSDSISINIVTVQPINVGGGLSGAWAPGNHGSNSLSSNKAGLGPRVCFAENGALVAGNNRGSSGSNSQYHLDDFDGGFEVNYEGDKEEDFFVTKAVSGNGERWELVF